LDDGRFLLATDSGLVELDRHGDTVQPAEGLAPSPFVEALARDGSGACGSPGIAWGSRLERARSFATSRRRSFSPAHR
jgi:hypothetical protein